MSTYRVLLADDDEAFCYTLREQLTEKGFSVDSAPTLRLINQSLNSAQYDLVLLDLGMPEKSGIEILQDIKANYPSVEVVILTGHNDAKQAVECMRIGAADYILKPYMIEELLVIIERIMEHKDLVIKNEVLEKRSDEKYHNKIIGESDLIKRLIAFAEKAARSESNVLIEGETGTGKELMAEFIHRKSPRAHKPFVVVNCASLPDQLIESELFGYEKGAFTDAKAAKQGLVEIANGGTLFLDEIGELSMAIQPKLLRFLENGDFRRIGGLTNLNSNVRVIGATNRNLIHEAEQKNFRQDLLFRLNVITLSIPALHERKEDIIILAEHFIKLKSPVRSPKSLSQDAVDALYNYHFPGNIRELEHIIERAIIFSEGNIIRASNLFLPSYTTGKSQVTVQNEFGLSAQELVSMEEVEKAHITKVLEANNWEQNKSAQVLGISLKTLYNKIKKYNLRQE
jgi:two-component system NtrC family response regulator